MSAVVVKVGSSSLTAPSGRIEEQAIVALASQVAAVTATGRRVVIVSSGAISAGLAPLSIERPSDTTTLQALAAVGQHRLMSAWDRALAKEGLIGGQVLLSSFDFGDRRQYLHGKRTLGRLLELGVVPVVNENDTVADDEIRFGDNDRLAALLCPMVSATDLILLTDTPGLLSADPRITPEASLIEEVEEADHQRVAALAGGPGSARGSGGMASKVAAARMAAWSGARAVIAYAGRPGVISDALDGAAGVGTVFHPRHDRLPARKLWIAFALDVQGTLRVDAGAEVAVRRNGSSLLHAGITAVEGSFAPQDAVEIWGPSGRLAKGLARQGSAELAVTLARRREGLAVDLDPVVVHRDDLVLLS